MQSHDDSQPAGPSRRRTPPARPPFVSGVATSTAHERPPKAVRALRWVIGASGVVFLLATAWAARRVAELRTSHRAELAEQAPKYSKADVATTVDAALVVTVLLGLLMVALELRAAQGVERSGRGARNWLVTLVVLHLPLLVITHPLRGGGWVDLGATVVQAGILVAVLVLTMGRHTTGWIRGQFTRATSEHLPSTWSREV